MQTRGREITWTVSDLGLGQEQHKKQGDSGVETINIIFIVCSIYKRTLVQSCMEGME